MKINLLNNMKKNYLAVISTILLALVIVAMALADPGGLFAVVSWTGSDPTAAYWWWAPYVVFTPLLLLLHVSAVRSVVGSAIMDRGRIGLFFRIWLIVILSTGVAWFINSVLVLYVSMAGSEYVLTVSSTLSFLLWSSGYATLKLACLGWLPALPAMMLERDPPTVQFDTGKGKNIAALTAGLTLFLVMILSPWLANHWWSGSPVGAVYQECLGLVAPTSVSGIFSSGVTLLICGSIVWIVVRSSLMHMSSVPKQSAVFDCQWHCHLGQSRLLVYTCCYVVGSGGLFICPCPCRLQWLCCIAWIRITEKIVARRCNKQHNSKTTRPGCGRYRRGRHGRYGAFKERQRYR